MDETQVSSALLPPKQETAFEKKAKASLLPANHILVGDFEYAMLLLNQQIGAVKFDSLKPLFLALYQSGIHYGQVMPDTAPLTFPSFGNKSKSIITVSQLVDLKSQALQLTTQGKFVEAVELFRQILTSLPLLLATSQDVGVIKGLIEVSREYIL